ncbi:cytochrome c peroxidase [Fibrella arboris]|uniref:cytochrome c peroxidase n=1 Tax=Fibrella arboris TaxID=3242486 RepID=UPI00352241EB
MARSTVLISLGILSVFVVLLLYSLTPKPTPAQAVKAQFIQEINELDSAVSQLQKTLANQPASNQAIQDAFKKARLAYKRVEFLSAYYSPETTKALNGSNLPDIDDDLRVNEPSGFQVLEELIFPAIDASSTKEAIHQAAVLRANTNRLRKISEGNEVTDSHIFDAMRLELFRLISLGITGFDSPVALQSLPETASALESLKHQLAHYQLTDREPDLALQIDKAFSEAVTSLQSGGTFNEFDRLSFIKDRANVLGRLLFRAQNSLQIPVFTEYRLLRPSAQTLTDSNAFDPNFFVNTNQQRATPERIALGKQLFYDPILSGNAGRSCASCHQPDRAFTDGESKSMALGFGGRRALRNAPTLINAALQAAQFADSRVVFLEDQASDVIQNKEEMHGSLPMAVRALQQDAHYRTLFTSAYDGTITESSLKNAIASYVRSLIDLDSRVDRYLRDQSAELTAEEKRGFNLFMGKASCATCHFFPLFNGTVPPAYLESESEVIGTPATKEGKQLDKDVGKFVMTQREPHRHAFKTPTIRRVAKTAPYMHNGVYQTLDEVVDFYNEGGGGGLGLTLANQTLPAKKLNLTPTEKKALIAFMNAL